MSILVEKRDINIAVENMETIHRNILIKMLNRIWEANSGSHYRMVALKLDMHVIHLHLLLAVIWRCLMKCLQVKCHHFIVVVSTLWQKHLAVYLSLPLHFNVVSFFFNQHKSYCGDELQGFISVVTDEAVLVTLYYYKWTLFPTPTGSCIPWTFCIVLRRLPQ